MAFIRFKPVSVFRDICGYFSTSRSAQWVSIVTVCVIAISAIAYFNYSQKRKAEASDEKRHADTVKSLYRFPSDLSAGAVVCGIDARTLPANLRDAFVNHAVTILNAEAGSRKIVADVLLPDFYANGYFDKAFAGDVDFLDSTAFFNRADILILVSPRIQFSDSSSAQGMKTCRVSLAFRKYQSGNTASKQTEVSATGAGFSDDNSMKKAFDNFDGEQKRKLQTILE